MTIIALLGCLARELPADLQSLPWVPVVVAAAPWFVLPAILGVVFGAIGRRGFTVVVALACIGLQAWWQYPYFAASRPLPAEAGSAVSQASAVTTDRYARVMTCNVYQGRADAATIVGLVRDQRVEVLALQETSDDFVAALDAAGIGDYLPYAQVASSDGIYGNGIWSATPLGSPRDDDVDSSASFMPGGTVTFGDPTGSDGTGAVDIRFVSVHTTSPTRGYWAQWRRSLDELALMRADTDTRYVFMGDFNATTDHTPFRSFLGTRFVDAAMAAGHGFAFTWPADRFGVPRFAGIDHIVLDRGIMVGQVTTAKVPGSDHAALIATIAVE
nr:endonuclease/exonuclease/phosphatase family protein [Bifidobacterium samirii]